MPARFDVNAYSDAWNAKNVDKLLEHYANDATLITPDLPEGVHGKEGIRKVADDWHRMFGDLRTQVVSGVTEGDKVAVLFRVQGTNTGDIEMAPGQRVPATGKPVDYSIGSFIQLDNSGKIQREVAIFDNAEVMKQLGLSSLLASEPSRKPQPR